MATANRANTRTGVWSSWKALTWIWPSSSTPVA
jgi:hypothetical protein